MSRRSLGRSLLLALPSLLVLTAPAWGESAVLADPPGAAAGVELVRPPRGEAYENGAAPDAIRFACSESLEALRGFFFAERLPYRSTLVRSDGAGHCHVHYEPTLRDFRALPEDYRVTELLLEVDSVSFLETGTTGRGDAVGALGTILREVDRPLRVAVSIPQELPRHLYEGASAAHFGGLGHAVALRGGPPAPTLGWAQDYVEAGLSKRGVTLLVPHTVFEGDPANGPRYTASIDRLERSDARVVRSKLAWDGGDLQFTLDPGDPRKIVLYYGGAAKPYWGTALTPAEYEYVLRLEFGADRAVDLSGLAPHVDYVVSFLPRDRTVLFAVPETGNRRTASSMAAALAERFSRGTCSRSLRRLADALAGSGPVEEDAVREAIERVREDEPCAATSVDRELAVRMQAFVEEHCPDRASCFSTANQQRMLERDPALFSRWVGLARGARMDRAVVAAHLDLIAAQLGGVPRQVLERSRRKIAELEALGFRVLPVPAFRVNVEEERGWPGVSYVNVLTVGTRVFVPRFGLGEAEDRLLARLAEDLGPGYEVVPVLSRGILVRSGGIHCLFGVIRAEPS